MDVFGQFDWQQVDALSLDVPDTLCLLNIPSLDGVDAVLQAFAKALTVVANMKKFEDDDLVRAYPRVRRYSDKLIEFVTPEEVVHASMALWHNPESHALGFDLIFHEGAGALKAFLLAVLVSRTYGTYTAAHHGVSISAGYSPGDFAVNAQFQAMRFPEVSEVSVASLCM